METTTPRHVYGGRGPLIMGITWTEAAVALSMVVARLFGASIRRGELRWDFVWVALACVFGITSQSLLTVSAANGLGMHLWLLDIDLISTALRYYWASCCVGLFGILFAKIAIIALLLGVKGPNQKKRGYFLHFLWVTNLLFVIVLTVMIYQQCNPSSAIWDITELQTADCTKRPAALIVGYTQGAWSAATDIALALYPISVVWDLQTSLKMKLGFCVLMSGGIITAVSSALRTYYIKTLAGSLDVTYTFTDFMIWGGTELWCIIILGSIPPLRPLFAKLFFKAKNITAYGSTSRTNDGYGNGTGAQGYGRGTRKSMIKSTGTVEESNKQRGLASVLATGNGSQEEVLPMKEGLGGIVVHSTFEIVATKMEDEMSVLEQGRARG